MTIKNASEFVDGVLQGGGAVLGAVENNFVSFNAKGESKDSGYKATDFRLVSDTYLESANGYIYPLIQGKSHAQDWGITTGHDVIITDSDDDSTSATIGQRCLSAYVYANNTQANTVTYGFVLPYDFDDFVTITGYAKSSAHGTTTATATLIVNGTADGGVTAVSINPASTGSFVAFTLTPTGSYNNATNRLNYCELRLTLGGNVTDTIKIRRDLLLTYTRKTN